MLSPVTRKFVSLLLAVILAFLPSLSQAAMTLPLPGAVLPVSGAFTPVVIKGMVLHPEDPLKFDFLMDTGTARVTGNDLQQEAERSIKYFLASLTVPENDLWVNLSPYEKDRIIPEEFSRTVMGRDLLGVDYVLKQMASSLLYPESDLGREFWQKVYTAAQQSGRSLADLPMDAFSRVWIMPAEAQVWENAGKVMITKSRLKVLLDKDYLSASKAINTAHGDENAAAEDILRALVIPVLEKEVNEGQNFARLRQIYAGMILAAWYKERVRDGVLAQAYAGQNKVAGVEFSEGADKAAIYAQYLESAHKGVYNYIREDADTMSGDVVPRKYFSGGFQGKVTLSFIQGSEQDLSSSVQSDVAQAQHAVGVLTVVSAGLSALSFSGDVQAVGVGVGKVLGWYPASLSLADLLSLWNGDSLLVGGFATVALTAVSGYAFWKYRQSLAKEISSDNNDAAMVSLSAVLIAQGVAVIGAAILGVMGGVRLTFAGYEYWQERKVKRLVQSLYSFDRQAAETLRNRYWVPQTPKERLFYKASLQDWEALSRLGLPGMVMLIRLERWDELYRMAQGNNDVVAALKVSMKQAESKGHYKIFNEMSDLLFRLKDRFGQVQYIFRPYHYEDDSSSVNKVPVWGWVNVMRDRQDVGLVRDVVNARYVAVQVMNDAAMLSAQQKELVSEQIRVTQEVLSGETLSAEERSAFRDRASQLFSIRWVPDSKNQMERLAYAYGLAKWETLGAMGVPAVSILVAEGHAWEVVKMASELSYRQLEEFARALRALMTVAEEKRNYERFNVLSAVLYQLRLEGGKVIYVPDGADWKKIERTNGYDVLAAKSMNTKKDASQLGGVNLNLQELNLQIQGQTEDFSRPFSGNSTGRDNITGYTPVIYHISPLMPQLTPISG